MTPEDVLKTMQRHSDENSKSGALGVMKGINEIVVDGDNVVFKLENANADLPYLLSDIHLIIQPDGGFDNPAAGIGTGGDKIIEGENSSCPNHWLIPAPEFCEIEVQS